MTTKADDQRARGIYPITLEDIRDRVAMVKHHGAVLQTCVEDREFLLRMVDDQATTVRALRVGMDASNRRVRELESLNDSTRAALGNVIAGLTKFIQQLVNARGGPSS